ncbi:hypothetical protein KSE_73100 [Kitasatospora setae KM-6054]|uniref:Uncharacterized protein n=1 Tax=Kitasatospora setae (strain ATCC 33774 / DSM 43861 / JCM 3304 / KCC A-0304 / NBRC 14216 / KM-6054) TaxID=452652 RepID=E4NJB7_KITSK|nr:hypothetical protein [Kitasatospora setae]BAJ33065.1 hypothetical protein KSE_73100 [Kitasatospora setae KM-6054]
MPGTGGYQLVAVFLVLVYLPSIGVFADLVLLGLYRWLGDRNRLERASRPGCDYTAAAAFPMFMLADTRNTAPVLLAVPVRCTGATAGRRVARPRPRRLLAGRRPAGRPGPGQPCRHHRAPLPLPLHPPPATRRE